MAGGRSLVRGSAPYRPARDDGDTLRAFANLPVFLPGIFASDEKASLLLVGIAYGLGAGFFEELGWTGFAVPTLRPRYGVLATGLIVGVLWGAWHFLVNSWASGSSSGDLSLALFLPAVLSSWLPAYRVLMVWVYDRIGGSCSWRCSCTRVSQPARSPS